MKELFFIKTDYPYLYPNFRAKVRRLNETHQHEDSFRLNASCTWTIELDDGPTMGGMTIC